MMSENIQEIASALCKFQGELSLIHKDKKGYSWGNDRNGYTYADLASIYDTIRPLLAKNGLSHIQPISSNQDNLITIKNILMHSSGQYIQSEMTVPVTNVNKKMNDWQTIGSGITYLRRYSLASMLGIATTDDDAASAPPITQSQNLTQDLNQSEPHDILTQLIAKHKIPQNKINAWLEKFGVADIYSLDIESTQKVIKFVLEKYNV